MSCSCRERRKGGWSSIFNSERPGRPPDDPGRRTTEYLEHERLDGANFAFDLFDPCDHVIFLACIAGKTMGLVTIGFDGIDQWLEFVRTAPGEAGDETFLCKAVRCRPRSLVFPAWAWTA